MTWLNLMALAPLLAALCCAAVIDWRSRRIPNWLTFSLILTGAVQSFLPGGAISPGAAGQGFLLGAGLTFALFALGALGAGDVKLMAGVGAWMGPGVTLKIFLVEAILGLIIVLAQAAWSGRLTALFRNSAVIAISFAHMGDLGVDHATQTGQSNSSIEKPLPYAVPVLLATLIVLGMSIKWKLAP